MSAAWPRVVNRLVAVLPTLPGWAGVSVYDGPPVTGDAPSAFITVGFVASEAFAGSYEQTRNGDGGWQGALQESGTVRSELICVTGDTDLPGERSDAFALVDAWEAWVSADETLGGVLGASSTSSLSVDVQPAQTTGGAVQRLTVTLSYFARGA